MASNLSVVFDKYMEARLSGEKGKPNPSDYIQRLPSEQQKELTLLIAGFEWALKKMNYDEIVVSAGPVEDFIERFWARVDGEKNQS